MSLAHHGIFTRKRAVNGEVANLFSGYWLPASTARSVHVTANNPPSAIHPIAASTKGAAVPYGSKSTTSTRADVARREYMRVLKYCQLDEQGAVQLDSCLPCVSLVDLHSTPTSSSPPDVLRVRFDFLLPCS